MIYIWQQDRTPSINTAANVIVHSRLLIDVIDYVQENSTLIKGTEFDKSCENDKIVVKVVKVVKVIKQL